MPYRFNISLSVLNHLWRNLYRNFITVLWEAVSNAWDADANNVWISISPENWSFLIKDDGIWMDEDDFQNKFLKVWHSKRNISWRSFWWRPYIGRKGIWKLALLSCADRITIITKKTWNNIISWEINNEQLEEAITEENSSYELEDIQECNITWNLNNLEHGTLLLFQWLKDEIHNSLPYLKKMIALYFRFSLIDSNFKIHLNDEEISFSDLNDLSRSTQFLWKINTPTDTYLEQLDPKNTRDISSSMRIKGFIASVNKPTDLRIYGTWEKTSLDLFVNGRLREKNILKHISTARITESYLYGQIHFDCLDAEGSSDAFTTSREWIIESNSLFRDLLTELQTIINQEIFPQRDEWRRDLNEDWDEEDTRVSKKQRKARSLFNEVASAYKQQRENNNEENGNWTNIPLDEWINQLSKEADFNIPSYVECFLSENLLRKYIRYKQINISENSRNKSNEWKAKENNNKINGNIPITIRQTEDELSYLDMDHLCNNVTPRQNEIWTNQNFSGLQVEWKTYKPLRDAVGHTALLTEEAKRRLTTIYDSIKAKINILLNE